MTDGYDLLRARRSIFAFTDQPVPADKLRRALDAGRFAQNHKLTEPWRFAIVGPITRAKIADVLRRIKLGDIAAIAPDKRETKIIKADKDARKLVSLPALVVVSMPKSPDHPIRQREDYAACSCAVQNIALALWADGIGMQWSTGDVTRDAETYRILDIDPAREEIIGFLKIGYPAEVPEARRELGLDDVTRELP